MFLKTLQKSVFYNMQTWKQRVTSYFLLLWLLNFPYALFLYDFKIRKYIHSIFLAAVGTASGWIIVIFLSFQSDSLRLLPDWPMLLWKIALAKSPYNRWQWWNMWEHTSRHESRDLGGARFAFLVLLLSFLRKFLIYSIFNHSYQLLLYLHFLSASWHLL